MSNWVPDSEPPSNRSQIQCLCTEEATRDSTVLPCSSRIPYQANVDKTINNKQYASWPGLTSEIVQKYYPESAETLKGHARKFKSGFKSTKKTAEPQGQDPEEESVTNLKATPTEELKVPTKKKKEIFLTTYGLQDDFQQKMYTDQTGRFPTKSSRGYQYIMVLVEP